MTEKLSRIGVPEQFRPHIIPVYPPNNEIIFEEWFSLVYKGCQTDRIFLDINFTSYWVNNDYGNNKQKHQEMQDYVDSLPSDKKYFCIIQYDDGCMVDWKGKDVLEFNMSKQIGVMLPLLCQPHPYKFITEKKWVSSFVGSRTHPIRNELERLKGVDGYYISFEPHDIEKYCRILHESIFVLCPRGYGLNSFRITEALQYGAIPIYISDEFIYPFKGELKFDSFGIHCGISSIEIFRKSLECLIPERIIELQDEGMMVYNEYYTYEGCFKNIIKSLEAEYNNRQ